MLLAAFEPASKELAIFYIIAVILFVLAGVGFKPPGERASLVGLGLAAAFFPVMWDSIALA